MMNVKINKENKYAKVTIKPQYDVTIEFEFYYDTPVSLKRSHTMIQVIGKTTFITVSITTPETLEQVTKKIINLETNCEYGQQWAYCQWAY